MNSASLIRKGLYVGTLLAAQNEQLLHNLHVSLIVNCCEVRYHLQDPSIKLVSFSVLQNGLNTIRDHFEQINREIDQVVEADRVVLIHCMYGMTRSCSCAIAYIMWKDHIPFEKAYQLVKSRRTECAISYEYETYLRTYEDELLHGATHSSINCNAVIQITGDPGIGRQLLEELSKFSHALNVYRCGTSFTEDPIYSLTRYSIPIYLVESEDGDCLAAELAEFLEPQGVQDVRVETLLD